MSDDTLGTYTFLPWLRRGTASAIAAPETLDVGAPSRTTLPVELTLNARTLAITTRLYGPGDVVGLDRREVVRTEPQAGSVDFPSNYFAAVDFAREDLPWLFTPLSADSRGRLRPWIALVAVRSQPGVQLTMRAADALPILEIAAPSVPTRELPDLTESWAWAHVQVTGTPAPGQTLEDLLNTAPHLGVSRLICPQRLLPDSHYFACVVPAFHAGVQAGMGIAEDVEDLAPAWDRSAALSSVQLPVYYHWEFSTGARGDFESLARALRPRNAGPLVGQRPMDVSRPGPGLPEIPQGGEGERLPLEGALRSPETVTPEWPAAARTPFEEAAKQILNAPADAEADQIAGPVLAPPLYGRWHARQTRVPDGGAEPHWFRELNLDPRYRAAAGLGTVAVQRDQEELMAEAWGQVGDILRANIELQRAQLARQVAASLRTKHLNPLRPDDLVHVTRPVHARVTMSPHTLRREIERSAVPAAATSGALRRLSRPHSTRARRLRAEGSPPPRSIPGRINAGEVAAATARANPDSIADFDTVSTAVARDEEGRLRRVQWRLGAIGLLLTLAAIAIAGPAGVIPILVSIGVATVAAIVIVSRRSAARVDEAGRLRTKRLTANAVNAAPPQPEFRVVTGGAEPAPVRPGNTAPGATDNIEAQRFRLASSAALERAQETVARRAQPARPALDLPRIAARLGERLDPDVTVAARMGCRLRIPPELGERRDPLDPVMAYPEFRRPMYEALAEISEEFVIPGLEHLPPNTVTLLETNPTVIQAFMTGLNHEMARELLWREYPTDQRGSSFRQFWDPSGRLPQARTEAERKARYDVPELHRWDPADALGESISKGDQHQLVLLVRGELLRRFPTAMIFAEHARRNAVLGRLEPDGEVKWPLFRGHLPPDVYFLGFALTEEEARGKDDDPGWYFVIQQQPTEPRFGLDEPDGFADTLPPLTDWDDLTWGHLATQSEFPEMTYVSVEAPLPDTSGVHDPPDVAWGGNAAQMAFITFQKPTRVAIHGEVMLPRAVNHA
jgi:hypothetical protein